MRDHKIGRLLVIDARGSLLGIVSLADVIARVPADIWHQLPGSRHPQPRRAA
jgi:CBS domain-containing protein